VGRWRVGMPVRVLSLPDPGGHGARCALLALAVADLLGIPPEVARDGLPGTALPGLRTEVRQYNRGVLLVDCYNANPQSTRAALAWLAALPSRGPPGRGAGNHAESWGPGARRCIAGSWTRPSRPISTWCWRWASSPGPPKG
jgi:hypothetical protein